MAHLKTLSGTTRIWQPEKRSDCFRYMKYGRGGSGVKRYLEKNDRSLATDLINLPTVGEGGNWGLEMDTTREMTFPFEAVASSKRNYRTYYHFILSPDPRDNMTLEQLRELATAWATEMFGLDDPKIGGTQVAIEYHDDNANEIMHAHIIVNNIDMINGGRLHFDKQRDKMIARRLQELCQERGYYAFDKDKDGVSRAPMEKPEEKAARRLDTAPEKRATMAERKLAKNGRPSWKQEIKDAIEVACNMADSPEQVVDRLAQMGIVAMPRKAKRVRPGEDYIFYYPQPGVPIEQNKKRVSGERLGRRYTAAGMRAQIRVSYYRRILAEDKDAAALLDMLVDIRDVQVLRGQTLSDLSNAFAAITNFRITNMQDAEKSLAEVRRNYEKAAGEGLSVAVHEEHIRQLEALLRVGPAANIVPLMREQSRTAQLANPADAAMARRQKSGEKIPLVEKVARGYRLTKAEYEELQRDPVALREWLANRRLASKGRKLGGAPNPRRGETSSSSARSQSGGRSRSTRRSRE